MIIDVKTKKNEELFAMLEKLTDIKSEPVKSSAIDRGLDIIQKYI
jgi:hypothetical protein